jgi:thiamine biosynthesis lipoprotein
MARLAELGIRNAIINSGGDLRATGSAVGRPWRIGIRNPHGEGAMALIETHGDEAIFTSGNYERYHEYEGRRFGHIIDPRSGYPAEGVQSVTVIHASATTADAAATALFVAGADAWPEVAAAMDVDHVMLLDDQGTIQLTPAMAERVELLVSDPRTVVRQTGIRPGGRQL